MNRFLDSFLCKLLMEDMLGALLMSGNRLPRIGGSSYRQRTAKTSKQEKTRNKPGAVQRIVSRNDSGVLRCFEFAVDIAGEWLKGRPLAETGCACCRQIPNL